MSFRRCRLHPCQRRSERIDKVCPGAERDDRLQHPECLGSDLFRRVDGIRGGPDRTDQHPVGGVDGAVAVEEIRGACHRDGQRRRFSQYSGLENVQHVAQIAGDVDTDVGRHHRSPFLVVRMRTQVGGAEEQNHGADRVSPPLHPRSSSFEK